jgi:hypothetical protein
MDYHAELAVIKQAFERLLKMHDPLSGKSWSPKESERVAYIQLAERSLRALGRVRSLERRKLLREGISQVYISDSILNYIRGEIVPREVSLRCTIDGLDPEGAPVRQMLEELEQTPSSLGWVNQTFETGIEQVRELLERNPDWGDDHGYIPDTACEVIDSQLIRFDPDAWLDRSRELTAIHTDRKNFVLPSHVRFRIEELNRAYIFGCWLSVLALTRAILEYAILDNLHKFSIEPSWPAAVRENKGKEKKLSHLIEELATNLPLLSDKLKKLRDYGNEYLHPKNSQVSKEALFQRQSAAQDALKTLIEVVEELYLARKLA